MNGHPQHPGQQDLPPWVKNTVGQVVQIWMASGDPTPLGDRGSDFEGFIATAGAGFLELVERIQNYPTTEPPTYTYRGSFLQIHHICRIAPVAAEYQWKPVSLAKVEKPKLVLPH
jgi:hypothetical protein